MADTRNYREYETTINGQKVAISLCYQSDLNMLQWNEVWGYDAVGKQSFALMMIAAKTAADKKNIGLLNLTKMNKIVQKWNEDTQAEEVD
jgi:hypothetical protein